MKYLFNIFNNSPLYFEFNYEGNINIGDKIKLDNKKQKLSKILLEILTNNDRFPNNYSDYIIFIEKEFDGQFKKLNISEFNSIGCFYFKVINIIDNKIIVIEPIHFKEYNL